MRIPIQHPYLVFPVQTNGAMKTLKFTSGGTLAEEMQIRLDPLHPNFHAYLDMRRFLGQTLEVSVEPEMDISFRFADSIDRADLYREPYRPYYHFTEKNGWTNDPNGMVQAPDGTYHMFYQLNPAAPQWENMHWGHAASPDMLHWTQQEIALFPDEMGTMFSGSGIVDRENRAGVGRDALLFFYTAAGSSNLRSKGQTFTQCLAYSSDGGKTVTKYAENPIIPNYAEGNRDPKVIFCEELNCWLLALYLTGNTYALYRTDDFKHWDKMQELVIPEEAECPDFYPLTADDGTRHWIFSGASGYYYVGTMENGQYVPTQKVKRQHSGSRGYAAQTYSTLPDGRRINTAWQNIQFPCDAPFHSQMSLPMEHTLRKTGEDYTLMIAPAKETKALRKSPLEFHTFPDGTMCAKLANAACELLLSLPAQGNAVTLTLLGNTVTVDRAQGLVLCGKEKAPVFAENGRISVHLYFDTCSCDIFTGITSTCAQIVSDENLLTVTCPPTEELELCGWELDTLFRKGS